MAEDLRNVGVDLHSLATNITQVANNPELANAFDLLAGIRQELVALRTDLRANVTDIRADVAALRESVNQRFDRLEDRLDNEGEMHVVRSANVLVGPGNGRITYAAYISPEDLADLPETQDGLRTLSIARANRAITAFMMRVPQGANVARKRVLIAKHLGLANF